MRYLDRFARALAFALLFVAFTDSGAAEFAAPVDDGWHVWQVQGTEYGDQVDIYAFLKAGEITEIRAPYSDCRVKTPPPANNLGLVPNAASIAWLVQQVDADSRVSEDAIAAISAHAGDAAFTALTDLLEDRSRRKKTREQALFWLAQTDSDQAFEYLDAILSSN